MPGTAPVEFPHDGIKYLINRDSLHANVVLAGRNALVECVYTGAASKARPNDMAARRLRSKYARIFRSEQGNDVNWSNARVVSRARIVRHHDFGYAVQYQELP